MNGPEGIIVPAARRPDEIPGISRELRESDLLSATSRKVRTCCFRQR